MLLNKQETLSSSIFKNQDQGWQAQLAQEHVETSGIVLVMNQI